MTEQTGRGWLTAEWQQRGFQAMKDTVDGDGSLKRQMVEFLLASRLWDPDALSFQSAISRFNNCLLPAKADFFKISHLWALMKEFDRHALFLAMADDLEYDVRKRATPERILRMQERAALAFENASNEFAHIRSLMAMQESTPPMRVHPAFRDQSGSFALPPPADAPRDTDNGDRGF